MMHQNRSHAYLCRSCKILFDTEKELRDHNKVKHNE